MESTLSRRSFLALSAAGVATLALTGVNPVTGAKLAKADGDTTLIVKADGDPMNFNPDTVADDNYFPVAINIFNRLVKLDIQSNVLPDAAESWDVSEDGLTIIFHLRGDLMWTDGEKLTAEDAAYTYTYIKENNSCFFSSYLAAVDSIEAADDTTVVFHMATPDIALVTNLAWYASFIMPKHVYDVEGVEWVDNPAAQLSNPDKVVSSGAFRLASYQQGQSISIVANETSPVQPSVSGITFSIITDPTTAVQALLNAEIDVYNGIDAANVNELRANPDLTVVPMGKPVPLRMIFNMNNETVANPAVRKAIAMCVDREDIALKVGNGEAPTDYSMYPPVIEWASNTTDVAPGLDIAAAEQELVDAGFTKDADGYYITGLTIDTFDFGGLPDMARLIIANMKQAGIQCDLNVMEANAWQDKCMTRKDYSICMMGGTMGPDPSSLALRYGTGASSNVGDWSNADFDALVAEANAEGDTEKRAELYKQAQAIMAQELPMVPVLDWVNYYGYANVFTNLPCYPTADDGQPLGDEDYTRVRLI